MKPKKYTITLIFVLLIATLFFVFRSLQQPAFKNTLVTTGVVEDIYETGTHHVIIKLKNDKRLYRIESNREKGLLLSKLKMSLTGKNIDLYYVRPGNSFRILSKIHFIAQVN